MTEILTGEQVTGVALTDRYLDADRMSPPGRPWLLMNMVSTADGAATIDGRSTALGGSEDRRLFKVIRTVADVIVVGANTVRAEGYGPPTLTDELRARRSAAGRDPVPRIAVVSGSLDLDLSSRLFTEHRPYVLTSEEGAASAAPELRAAAEVIPCGSPRLDPASALSALADRGASIVLSEGGPSLNGQLLSAGLVDEFCLTLDPTLAGGDAGRIVRGRDPSVPHSMSLSHVGVAPDGVLFLRYVRG